MTYLLDTNTIIRYLNGRAPNIRAKISVIPSFELAVPEVVVAELRYGAAKSTNPARVVAVQDQFLSVIRAVSFDRPAAEASWNDPGDA